MSRYVVLYDFCDRVALHEESYGSAKVFSRPEEAHEAVQGHPQEKYAVTVRLQDLPTPTKEDRGDER